MMESEVFALLEQTADAAYSVTGTGEICSWNRAAEQLFGYSAAEVIGRHLDEVLDAHDALGKEPLIGGKQQAPRSWGEMQSGIPSYDLYVRAGSGARLWINVSTIVFDNPRTARRLFILMARDITQRQRREEAFARMLEAARQVVALHSEEPERSPVNPLSAQELRVLTLFAKGHDPAGIARKLKITPHTLRNHLQHINRKLRTHTRLEAVTHARRRGLIE